MAAKQKVLILGAHGESGGDILNGLLEDGGFEISCLVQPSSAEKPAVKALQARGLPIVISDISGDVDELAKTLHGFDTVISAIHAMHILAQIPLVDAAAKAGVKRFVPCDFAVTMPPGVSKLRDEKEAVHQRIWQAHIPYTFIDVGYWHQLSWFRVPSGRLDYALTFDTPEVFGDGNTPTLLSDKRDMGRFVARIIADPRTLNHSVIAWSDSITQNQILHLISAKTGETPSVSTVSASQLDSAIAAVEETLEKDPSDSRAWVVRSGTQYNRAKWIRGYGTLEYAKYLGYLDARELYPDIQPIRFETYVDELVAGKAKRPYGGGFLDALVGKAGDGGERHVLKTV
ncbi:hypothetical protein SLS60_009466 [Paraconiothyrium brasiliense]|uniref:NmrA-like domain-containing protein n=1 Tax=Paraconiothyrium brasiliense TaxID=300254 RepID=A0ABR3QUE1_9PLEO